MTAELIDKIGWWVLAIIWFLWMVGTFDKKD